MNCNHDIAGCLAAVRLGRSVPEIDVEVHARVGELRAKDPDGGLDVNAIGRSWNEASQPVR